MYIKPILLLSLNYSDIPGGVVVSTTDCEAIDHKFKTHLGPNYFLVFLTPECLFYLDTLFQVFRGMASLKI